MTGFRDKFGGMIDIFVDSLDFKKIRKLEGIIPFIFNKQLKKAHFLWIYAVC